MFWWYATQEDRAYRLRWSRGSKPCDLKSLRQERERERAHTPTGAVEVRRRREKTGAWEGEGPRLAWRRRPLRALPWYDIIDGRGSRGHRRLNFSKTGGEGRLKRRVNSPRPLSTTQVKLWASTSVESGLGFIGQPGQRVPERLPSYPHLAPGRLKPIVSWIYNPYVSWKIYRCGILEVNSLP